MILSFIRKVSFFFLMALSSQVFANDYYHENFINSEFHKYIQNNNKKFILIKNNEENLKSRYRHPQFNNMLFSVLYEDGVFAIYLNKELLTKECVYAFQFHDSVICRSEELTNFMNKFTNHKKYSFYKYKKEFNYFLFYHEFSHLLINEKWGFQYHESIEFIADLMALDMMWQFHNIDFRKDLESIREKNFYFKSDLRFKYHQEYSDYKLTDVNIDFNIEEWFSKILSFKESSFLKEDEKDKMKKNIKEVNKIIMNEMMDFSKNNDIRKIEGLRKFISMKISTEQFLIDNL